MSVRIEAQAEPVPGYKLIARLGSGGFGEVWKAEAPGGIFKAIKIIHGDLRSRDSDLVRYAEQELKSLKRVKQVRHPYLLALDRYDIVDGRLMIVMELADCNLWDRFRECRNQGLAGIPRDELLLYMSETAEVLDLMNDKHQLQHLDIKPQNLFLLYNHVKVADFGQVKDLQGVMADVTGGITPVYAAPETFDGIVTKFCDQYSLACVYQELLTGVRPFDGASMSQLLMQHLNLPPNLDPSPAADRPALVKALSKKAEDRWPSVAAFVRALRGAGDVSGRVPAPGQRLLADPPTVLAPDATPERAAVSADTPPPNAESMPEGQPLFTPAPAELTGPGPLRPTLIIGLGQAGLRVLQRFRFDLAGRYGPADHTPLVRTLYIDTDPDALDDAGTARPFERLAALSADDVFAAKLHRAAHYLKPRLNGRSLTEGWFDAQLLYRIPRTPQSMGLRLLGRLAFCDHYRPLVGKIQAELDAALSTDALHLTEQRTGLPRRTNRPRVYVVAGLAGGTGGGMLLDVAYAVRGRLRRLGYENPEIVGLFVVPPADPTLTPAQALGNTYATLTELNHYSRPDTTFTANYDDRQGFVRETAAPFTRFYLTPGTAAGLLHTRTTPVAGSGALRMPGSRTPTSIPHPGARQRGGSGSGTVPKPGSRPVPVSASQRTPDPAAGLAAMKPYADTAEFLRLNLFTPLGRVVDEARTAEEAGGVAFASFGQAGYEWPRAEVVGCAAGVVAGSLLKAWVTPNLTRTREVVPGWAAGRWSQLGLDPDILLGHFQRAAERALGGKIEEQISLRTEPLVPRGWLARLPEPDKVVVTVDQLSRMFGPPASAATRPPTPVEVALDRAAGETAEGFLLDLRTLGQGLVENPQFRFAGAEEVLRQFLATTDRLTERYTQQAADQDAKAQAGYEILVQYTHFQKGARKPTTTEFADALRQFPRARVQAVTFRQLVAVYQVVRDALARQLKDATACRQRLAAVVPPDQDRGEALPGSHRLMPAGCPTVADAAQRYLGVLGDPDLDEIDRRVQAALEPALGGLYQACLNSAAGAETVVAAVREETRAYLDARLGEVDLAAMFADRFRTPQQAEQAIGQAFQEADPGWAGSGPWAAAEVVVLAAPPGPTGEPVREIARRAIPVAGLPTTDGRDGLTVYREWPAVPLAAVPQLGPAAAAAYEALPEANQCSAHARLDVTRWVTADAT